MGEIKFRAWIKSERLYIYLTGFCYENKDEIRLFFWIELELPGIKDTSVLENELYFIDGIVLEQYTGFIDENEKEIYKNDIVKTERGIGIIEWDNSFGCWCINYKDEEDTEMLDVYYQKIIGNIHEKSLEEFKNETE